MDLNWFYSDSVKSYQKGIICMYVQIDGETIHISFPLLVPLNEFGYEEFPDQQVWLTTPL